MCCDFAAPGDGVCAHRRDRSPIRSLFGHRSDRGCSIFGSSSHLINGPTNAISLVVFSALAFFDPDARFDAYQATFLLGVMVGTIQIFMAVFKLGDLTR